MIELYSISAKMFYKWTSLIIICCLPIFGQEYLHTQNKLGLAERVANNFKLRLHQMMEEVTTMRRDMIEGKVRLVPSILTHSVEIESREIVTKGCIAHVTAGSEKVFVVTATNTLSIFQNLTLSPLVRIPSNRKFLSLQAFEKGEKVWLIAQHTGMKMKHFVNIYDFDFKEINRRLRINLPVHSLIASTKFGYRLYLAVASTNAIFPDLTLYQWVGTQMDEIVNTPIDINCSSLTIWNIGDDVYVALSFVDFGRLQIQRFIARSLRMSNVQFLNVEAYILKNIEDAGSHFLICGTRDSVIIYWWTGSIFLPKQTKLFGKTVNDIAVNRILDRLVIAVVFDDEIEFLVQDSSARYVNAGGVRFDSTESLKSILLWKYGGFLFMLPLFKKDHRMSVYKISLKFEVSDLDREPTLEYCVNSLQNHLTERREKINEVSSIMENIWKSSDSFKFVSLKVKGTLKSLGNSSIRSLYQDTVPSPVSLELKNHELSNAMHDLRSELTKTVLKSEKQQIKSNFRFTNLRVGNGSFGEMPSHVNLNKVPTNRLLYALKKTGHQIFPHKTMVVGVSCRTVSTNLLNGNRTENYVLLNPGYWNLTGNFIFANISAKELFVKSNKINDLNIQDIVLTSKKQQLHGVKSFRSLLTKSVRTNNNFGELHLDKIKRMIDLNSRNFTSSLNFIPTLIIKGNLNILLINNKNASLLNSNSVKMDERQDIYGNKTFKSMMINKNTNIRGGINKFALDNLMTINTDQKINGTITFSNAIRFENVLTDSLNGLDLSQQAVIRLGNNEVKGLKIFRKNLKVSSIVMKDGVLIDLFDPSDEVSNIALKVEYADNSNITNNYLFTNNITMGNVIANNVQVDEGNFPFLKELDNLLLKTSEQNISCFEAKNMRVDVMHVLRINGIAVEDLVTVSGNSYITAAKEFRGTVTTGTLNLREVTYINYSPGFWNPDIKVRILGNISMEDAVLERNLSITGSIKGLESGVLRVDALQALNSRIQFDKIELNELISKEVNFDLLNNIDIKRYYERAVLLSKNIRILNKTFQSLKGTALICNGTLNNLSIEKVATTNTKQKLVSSFEFRSPLSFKKLQVKNFFDDIVLDDVIYTDKIGNIANKYFSRSIKTPHLFMSGNINGVNITRLKQEFFNKSGDNVVQEKITFQGNLKANKIQVNEGKRIDNVDLDDLIKLKDSLVLESLNASSITAENVTVKGRINGCTWTPVIKSALSLKKHSQNLTARMRIKSLEIYGDLKVQYLNGARISDWIFLMNITTAPENEANMIFERLRADNIQFLETINNISLSTLMNDCVRKTFSQIITGNKIFKEIDVANATISFLNSNVTCGVDISRIFEMSVNESAASETVVHTKLTVQGIEGKRVIIAGNLNNLRLPDDVVLSNTSEVFENEVTIDSFNASNGLNVSGKISNVYLESFLKDRVTLQGPEPLSSEIIFEDDIVIGNCTINGTLNNIRMMEIVNLFQNQTVNGAKNFTGGFQIMSNLFVNESVNELFMDQLKETLLLKSRNESVKNEVNFASLNSSSLTCGTINGHDVTEFYNHTHTLVHNINDKLNSFTSSILLQQDLLRSKRDSVEHPLSLYHSFELREILNLGIVQRFLPVYEYGMYGPKYELQVTQMIIWVETADPCRKTKSLIADVLENGTLNVTNRMRGKIFPFSLSFEKENVIGFYVQAEHVRSCQVRKKTRLIVTSLYSTGDTSMETIVTSANSTLLDVRLLELHETFLIISYSLEGPSERIHVYQYNTSNNSWSSHQRFHLQNLTSLDVTSIERDTDSLYEPPSVFLSVTGDESNPGVTIYDWDFYIDEFILKTNISTSVSSNAIWVNSDRTLYLLLAKEMSIMWKENSRLNVFTEPLEVYTLEEELFLNHTVSVKGVRCLEVFSLADEMFVLAASNHMGTLYVLQFRGYNGFEVIQEIPSPGITEAHVYTVESHLYLALNSRTGQSRILKASVRGGRLGLD